VGGISSAIAAESLGGVGAGQGMASLSSLPSSLSDPKHDESSLIQESNKKRE